MRRNGRKYSEVKKPQISPDQHKKTTLDNVEETLTRQNPEKRLKQETKAKFSYVTKRATRNLVIEVDPSTRGKPLTARIKLGWAICQVDDYIVAKRCYRCSRYHIFRECKRGNMPPVLRTQIETVHPLKQ